MATHHFTPEHYFSTLGAHPPVLRVADGDMVVTSIVDAAGRDATGERVTPPGNPMTGPFYVEGAEPGDTLVLHIDRLTPNRRTGWSSAALAPNVVEPHFVPQLPEAGHQTWLIEPEAGVVRPDRPGSRLERLCLPLAPMLGCFGVAPAHGEAISTATSGPHGGNMDYRGFTAGVTVYLPVFVPGALLHLGDGHAVQGDGEIVGTGVETSFEAAFTVRLRKDCTIGWPRGENDDFIFTVGNARPLDQAVQHATTEMARWLMSDYGLDATEASLLLGQCVAYDVGNVFDPAYTMVCKVPKAVLAAL